MIAALHHVAIATRDLARLEAFYCGLLGFGVEYRGHWEKGNTVIDAMVALPDSSADFAILSLNGQRIELFRYHTPDPKQGDENRPVCDSGITHLCFQVDDIASEYRRLTRAGVRFHAPPPDPSGRRHIACYGRDPDGNAFELIQIVAKQHPFGEVLDSIAEPAS